MPVDISSIPPEDRDDFQKRLKVYGLDISSVQEELTVTPAASVKLAYGPGRESARTPFLVQTGDLSQVKRMVGVDDRVFRNVAPRVTLPKNISLGASRMASRVSGVRDSGSTAQFDAAPGISSDGKGSQAVSDEMLAQLDGEDIDNIRLAARAFVRSNSQLVSSYEPLFSKVIGNITLPVWPMLSVTVASGSVLEFGTGVHALVAYQVTIEEGGKIVSRGHLTVNCTRFTKPGRFRPGLAVGGLTTPFRPIFSE